MLKPWGEAEIHAVKPLIRLALEEDLSESGDLTSLAVIPADLVGLARFVMRSPGVLAGLPIIAMVSQSIDKRLQMESRSVDGQFISSNATVATISGPLRSILAVERTALNFMQRLSGIASLTRRYVDRLQGSACQVLDTRKTTPGWRVLEKYAVRCGGGNNHRMGLFDAVLIKDNHLAGLRKHGTPLAESITKARAFVKEGILIEIEVESLEQLVEALTAKPDVVMLDNMNLEMLRQAVTTRNAIAPSVRLEASGGINLETIQAVAGTGVEFISVGALTHSAKALDIALDYQE